MGRKKMTDAEKKAARKAREAKKSEQPEGNVTPEIPEGPPVETVESKDEVASVIPSKPPVKSAAELDSLKAQVALLTSHLSLLSQTPEVDDEDEIIGVVKIFGPDISAFLNDPRSSEKKHFLWQKDGDILYLSTYQYDELLETPGGKKFFDRGYLKLEDEAGAVQALIDPDAFITAIAYESIETYFQDVSDAAVMQTLLNHIDNKRIVTEDEQGRPLTDAEGYPRVEVVKIPPKFQMVAQACATRLYELTGIRYSLLDG